MLLARFLPRAFKRLVVAASLAAPLLAAAATTLYTQPFAETANGGYYASTLGGFLQFDSFTLGADSTIESVRWYGVDLNELLGWTPVNPTLFTVAIHADDGNGMPGSVLTSSTIGDSAAATNTGTQLLGLALYQYTGTLTTPFHAAAGTTYWIGISDPTTNGNWFWASGSGPDATHAGIVGGTPAAYADDMSFTLDGTITAVPEPASSVLFLLGAAGLLGMRAKQQRRRQTAV